jgi:ADP-ribosylglycohydrolase
MNHSIHNAILGLVVGDALGVPVEFKSREYLKEHPITDMVGYGTYNQPPGTWSDDSSLALCLAEELTKGFSVRNIGESFVEWLYNNHWTPHGEVFDVGNTTGAAIERLKDGIPPEQSGIKYKEANGNGSLMRILPLLFYVQQNENDLERYEIIRKVSAITHAHVRSTLSCFYYLEFARLIKNGVSKKDAYKRANESLLQLTDKLGVDPSEVSQFSRLTDGTIDQLEENQIYSDTYVIYTLEASVWSILITDNYKDAVLRAVNLGKDTDTTAAVTGGLAGLMYGAENIPKEWITQIARLEDIEQVVKKLEEKYEMG